MSWSISEIAYVKALMHAAAHPDDGVFGLLLASTESVLAEGKKKDGEVYVVTDAIPLFHTVPVAPMMSTAMGFVEVYVEELKADIVGVYYAPPFPLEADQHMLALAKMLAEKVADASTSNGPVCVFAIDNALMTREKIASSAVTGKVLQYQGKKWTETSGYSSLVGNIHRTAADFLFGYRGRDARIHDFDDHLEDPRKDWRNEKYGQF